MAPSLADVILDLPHVVGQLAGAHAIVGGGLRVEERLERHLGVHDDGVVARQVDDQIGAKPPGVGERGRLQVEVAVLQHARQLHHLAQLDFAPPAADPGGAQGPNQRLGLAPGAAAASGPWRRAAIAGGGVVDAVLVGFDQRRGHLREGVPDGRDHRVERLLAVTELRGGGAVDVADLLVGELEELPRLLVVRADVPPAPRTNRGAAAASARRSASFSGITRSRCASSALSRA